MDGQDSAQKEPCLEDLAYELHDHELFWKDHYTWLLEKGYQLRPRYSPTWAPSWRATPKPRFPGEDRQRSNHPLVIDALRVQDNTRVMLKKIVRERSPTEMTIMQYLAESKVPIDPRNHNVPMLDAFKCPVEPGIDIAVVPLLRPYDDPEFDTIGEGLDFISQVLEGFSFLHEIGVAHQDVRSENILMDSSGMYAGRTFHPMVLDETEALDGTKARPRYSRTERPPRYLIIDFGISRHILPGEQPEQLPEVGSDPSVPEYDYRELPSNLFLIDTYTLGNMIRMDFMDGNPLSPRHNGRRGYEFLRPLTDAMTKRAPRDRITLQEALATFQHLVEGMSTWKLRSRSIRVSGQSEYAVTMKHWALKASYVVRRLPPIPRVKFVAGASSPEKDNVDC